jgi:N-acetylglucosamine malate deacetylase 1
MRVLAIGAHSDDMDLFCGGTLARFAAAGDAVGICSLTDGRNGGMAESPEQLAARRKVEFEESAAVIGAEAFWPAIEDGMLTGDLATRARVADIIRSFMPDLIITHPPDDYHPDHTAASRLVRDASFMARVKAATVEGVRIPGVAPILFCEAESGHSFLPDQYVDVTDTWPLKARMLNAHRSTYEWRPKVQPDDPDNWVLDRAEVVGRFRGLQCGTFYAEAYRVWRADGRVRPVRLVP